MNRPISSSATFTNNKNHPSSSSSSSSTCADDLERKLQGIESSLRQDRESARRQKQLAAERLRLLQQEFDAMDKTVQGLQNKLHSIRDESTNILVPELQSIRTNVDQLTKEADFQHAQLVQKRNKTKDLHEASIALDRKQRGTVQNLRQVIHQRRSSSSSPSSVTMMVDENIVPNQGCEGLAVSNSNGPNKQRQPGSSNRIRGQQDLSGGTAASIQFWKDMATEWGGDGHAGRAAAVVTTHIESLPRLLGTKAERMQTQATRMVHGESAPMHRIVTGYEKHLQLTTNTAAAAAAMSTRDHVAANDPAQDGDTSTDDCNNNNNKNDDSDSIDASAPNQE